MNRKEILTIILLICVIFSLQAVVAADSGSNSTDSNVLSVDNVSAYTLPSSDSDSLLGNDNAVSFSQLQQDIQNGGSEITLTKNYTYMDTDSGVKGITISANTKVINGNGNVIIDANHKSRIFVIAQGANVTLKGITFVNANSTILPNGDQTGHGGSIFANGEVHIDNCNFIDNTATYGNGAGVFIKGSGSTITNSYFKNNRALNNGNDGIGAGAAVFIVDANNVKISHTTFVDNYAGLNGGAIASKDGFTNCTIINCTFEHNTANGSAGAVGMQGTNFKMYNSTFKYNEARGLFNETGTTPHYPGNGGGIVVRAHDSYVYNTTFINNTAKLYGGASFLTNTSSDPTNNNTKYELCTFINNTAGSNGGALYWVKGAHYGYVLNSTFTNNTANRSGGAIYWFGTIGTIKHSNFTNNTALGIFEDKDSYGTMTYGGNGGAIMWVGSDGTVYNCTFTTNDASNKGGAVYLQGSSEGLCNNTMFDTCKFISNIAGVNGGAIDWYCGARNGHILNSVFEDNIANRSGGAIFWSGIGGEIKHSNFTNNSALGIKEALDTYGDMTYGGYGGAVMWTGPNGTIDNCRFINNEAKYNEATNSGGRGGAIYLQGSATDNCTNTTFSNCNFTSNIAGTNGGAIDWHEGAHNGKIINSSFNHNIAYSNGGAIYWRGHDGNITGSNFTNNTAKGVRPGTYGNIGDGGAIYWAGINGDVDNCRFIENEAVKNDDYVTGGRGGAVFLDRCSHGNKNTTFWNVYFENNIAGTNGGAIDWHDGAEDGLVDNATFINNTAHRNGGAIFWHGHNGTIKNSRFTNNRATGTAWEYAFDLNMGTSIVVQNNGNLIRGNIYIIQNSTLPTATPTSSDVNKLFVLNYTNGTKKEFKSYVAHNNGTALVWLKLDEIALSFSESIISPVDWAIDQYYGGDGGTLLWSGDLGLIYNCTFTDSNSARRGGGAYMTGSNNVTYNLCNFTNSTSGTNGGGVDWLAGANYGKIYNCIFNNTRAARSAGAIYYDGWYGDMQNITIINTTSYGGALKQSKDKLVNYAGWDSSHWDTNTTGGDAGAIMFTGSYINVYNVTFTNCTASGRGGAVFLQDNHDVTFDLCTFENNNALGAANNTYTNDKDVTSRLNKWNTGHGGAIGFDLGATNGTIKNSKFFNNTAARDGGAIFFAYGSMNGTIYNSTFDNNTAKRNGGAFCWDGTGGNVSYCNFTGNKALGTVISKEYAILTSLDDVINVTGVDAYDLDQPSTATDNKLYVLVIYNGTAKAKYELYVSQVIDTHYWFKIDETTETGPSPIDWAVDEYFGGDGGSIYWGGDNGTIDHCNFLDSDSARRGGGAYMTGGDHVNYFNCTFENCTSGTNGGGLDWLAGANYGTVIDCNFTHTQAARSAGAIYYDGDYGVFRNIIIKNTTAHGGDIYESKYGKVTYARWDSSHWDTNTTGGDGGAIMFTGDNINVYNATITDCTAAGRGGAVFLQDNDNVTFELCRFENNRALGIANNTFNDPHDTSSGLNKSLTGEGGAISFDIGASESSIINSTFINNTAKNFGGAVHFREGASKDRIINSTFEINHVDEDGGALYIDGDDCELHNSTFTDNYAGDDGGAIFWKGNVGTIYNITCVNNSGRSTHGNSKGGTICLNGNNISLSDSSFKQSYAKVTGGALFVTGNYVNITGTEFEDCNVTTETGGAIQILGDHVLVRDSTFNECHAPNGGAIYVEGEYVKIIGSEFTSNNVTKDGAALYVYGDYSELHNSTFRDNVAGDDGGAIYWEGSQGTIYNITCENNKGISAGDSNSNGGTICLTGDDVTLSESSFKGSYAGADGGAIFVTGDGVTIKTTDFENCTSIEEGGAIYVLGDDTTILECNFEDCNATQGGAIYVEGDRATISVNITDTHALGADSYGIVVDYKFYKDNVKEIKYDIDDTIKYVATIKTDDNFINETIEELNTTLNELYAAVDNILTDDGINTTNVTRALDIVRQLNERLAQINASLSPGKDKNITLQLISDMENIGNELNYLIDISKTLEIPASVTAEIDDITAEVNAITPGDIITDANKTALISTLDEIRSDVEKMLDGNTFNATNIEHALELLKGLTDTLKELNATLPNGNDKNTVINLLGEVKDIENQLTGLSDMVVVPEVVSRGGAIYISGNEALIDGSVINSTDAVYGGGLYISGHDVKVDNSEFINLYSTEDGGAIYITGQRGNLYNSKFINNTAGDDGGAINWDGNNGKIYNITCENNRGISFNGSSSNGGTISLTGNNTSIEKSSFAQTYALISGGAIFVTGNGVNITDSEFKDCNVSMNISETHKSYANGGGAIYVLGNSSNIVNCTFEDSEAREGGAIYVQGRDVTINKSNFTDSTALNGGTIYIDGDRAIVIGCNLNNTIAGNDSHALFDENLDVSAFEEGLLGKGGAIYIKSENAQILDSTISSSYTTHEGGAIYVEGNNATISVDFVDCGAGYPVEWVTPDRDLFKPAISNILIRVNGLIAYNKDINNGFSDNFTNIYNSIYSIRTNLVDKIFINKNINVDNLHFAIGNLTELNNAIPQMVTDSDLLNTLELSSLIQLLCDIPDNGTYGSYYNSKVKPVFNGLATRMNYANIIGYDNSYLYKRLQLIKNNLVDKIFIGNSHTFNAANLNAAIGNLTELYDCVKYVEKYGSYDDFLNNLTIIIDGLKSIPNPANYSSHESVRKTASNNINSLMTYSRNIKNNYGAYNNNLNSLKTKLNNLNKQKTLRDFNRAVYDISVIIENIESNLDLLLDVYAGSDFTELSNNFTYVKSQIAVIQNAGESLQNLGVKGGAIYVAGNDANITGSTFLRCLASNALKGEGGAIYITGVNTTITGSDFMNCSAPDNGGSIYVNGKNAKVEKSTFNITSAEVGGAIYILGSETTIDSSSFVDSSADYRGGAIYIEGLKATVKDSNFTDSEVTGGIFNNTNPRGGAIYIKENYATVEGSIFNNSSVSTTVGDGGAIYIEGDYAKILGSEFEYSSAHVGGAIYLEGDSCNVSESTFTYSLANENGGAMYSTGSKSTVYNSNFTNNLAELSGGAVYWYGGSKSKYNTVDGCIFTNNTAHGNTADASITRGGGAIYWSEGGQSGTIKNSKFYYNSVQSTIDKKVDGGAVLWDKSSHALVDNCIFVGNFVTTNGDTSGTSASSVWAQGGAMYLRPNTNYTVRNCLFENCSSSKEAGALYIQGQNSDSRMILLENSVFKNNVAYANGQYNINGGGAIQIKQCYNAVFNNLTFINNTANKGGALCVYDSVYNLVVTGANFTENKANRGSAISASVTFTLNDAVLLDNRADTSTFDLTLDRAGSTIDILLEGNDNRLNAMYVKGSKSFSVTCNNVTYWTDNNISIGKTNVTSSPQSSGDIPVPEAGISITVELFDANNNKLNEGNDIFATDANGELHLIPSDFGLSSFENVYVKARLTNENYYTQVEATTRLPASMEANAHNVTYHRNATVNVTITPSTGLPAASGIVSVYYGDVFLGNITVNNNVGESINKILTNITADKFIEVGTHNLTLKYWGDLYNDELNITVPINVTKAQSNITIVDFDEIGYDIFIRVTIVDDWNDEYYADATGNVTLNVYGHDLTTPIQSKTVYLVNGTGTTFFDLLPANYTIKATYDGDDNYNASVNSTAVELHPKQDIRILIDIDATAGDIMVDDTVDINVTIVTPEGYEATGNVTLYLDNVKYILPLNDSKAKFNKTGLPAGFKIVTVCYDGSKDLQSNYGDANFTVYKYNTTFTINATNITHNQKEIINVTFLNETEGVVYIYVNDGNYSAIINNRTAIFELSNLTVGEYNVTVKFPGDWKFNNVTNMTRFYVKKVVPDAIIDVDNVTYGNPTNIIINVPDCVSGNVSIEIDGTPYGDPKAIDNGKVEFNVGILAVGNYTVEAIYGGDANHTSASYKQNFTVYKANRTIDIEVKDIVYGDVEHIEVYVNASGNVTITVNGKSKTIILNESGKAGLDVYNLSAKTYTVDVVYNGNDNYTKSSANKTFTVSQMPTSLDVKVHDVLVRGMEYINITVMNSTGGVATNLNGTLTINIDGVDRTAKIVNGTASFNTTEFNNVVGKRVVWVFFNGDANFKESRAMKTYQVTARTLTANDLNVTAQNITVGQTGNITVNLPKDITGYVVIEVKAYNGYRNDTYYKEVNNGEAVVYPEDLREGKYHVYVTYKGTDYKQRFTETLFTVSKVKVNVTIDVNDTVYGNTSDIVVYVDDGVEGSITIKINDTVIGTFAIVDGKVNTTVKMGAGKYTVYAEYNGNYKYNTNKTESESFTVERAVPTITIDPVTVDANTSAVIVVHINDTATGTINITANKQNYTADIIDGVATFDMIPVLPAGTYNVTANYYALSDTNYTVGSKYIEVGITVTKIKCYPMNVSAENITVGQNTNITVNVPDGATGYVIIWVNGTDYINRTIVNGEVKFSLGDDLKEGVYAVNATLIDDNYENRVVTTFFTVSKVDTPISIDVNEPVYVNDTAVITVTVPDGIKDIVTIEINGESYTNKSVSGNDVIFEVPNITYGNKTVVAIYGGDDKFRFNSTTENFTVHKRDSFINVNATDGVVDGEVIINVTVPENAIGYVVVNVNGTNYTINLTNGDDRVAVKVTEAGLYNVTVTYVGDNQFNVSNNNTTFTVSKLNTAVRIDVNDTVYDNKVNITVYVDNGVEGTITIKLNDTDLGTYGIVNGKVNITIENPGAEEYTVYAIYNGNYKYNVNNTASKNFTVARATPVITIDPVTVDANNSAIITVHINDTATGTINITVNDVNYTADIIDGVATFSNIPVLPVGEYNIAAYYFASTDTNFTVGNVTLVKGLNVTKVKCYPMNVSTVDVKAGEETTITVYVPGDATGKVYIDVNGTKLNKTVSGGKAEFKVTKEVAGRYVVNATLVDAKYANKTIIGNYYVDYANTVLDIDVTEPVYVNDTAEITVTVPDGITGEVTIEINGESYNNKSVNGNMVTFEVPNITYGNKTVVAIYSGDSKYAANSTTENFTVYKRDSFIKVNATDGVVDGEVIINVTVPENTIGYVIVNVNGTNYTINLTNGDDRVAVKVTEIGLYNVTVTYIGDDQYLPNTNETNFTVSKLNTAVRIDVNDTVYDNKVNITVYVDNGVEGTITIKLNDTDLGTYGIADGKVNITIENPGAEEYTVYAIYNGNYKYNVNNTASKNFTVARATPVITIDQVIVDANNSAIITVHINDTATGTINITVNDVNYTADIIDGVATFDMIPVLSVGEYNITANYYALTDTNYTVANATLVKGLNVTKVKCYPMNVSTVDVKAGEETTITVYVPTDATGKVFIDVNGTKLNKTVSGGKAEFKVTKEVAGRYVVNATLVDAKYANKTIIGNYYVDYADTVLDIDVTEPVYVNDTATITVTVPDGITGHVTIEINGKSYNNTTVEGNKVIFKVPNITYGNKTVVAIYEGDSKYAANSTTENFTVYKRDSFIKVNVTQDAAVDDEVIINVTVPANAIGYVVVNVNGTNYTINLTDGQDRVAVKVTEAGLYNVTVTYIGDDQFLPSNDNTTFTVDKILPNINATVTNDGIIANGSDVVVFIHAPIDITGKVNVTVWDMDKNINTTYIVYVNEGEGNLSIESPEIGLYNVTVRYLENRKYLENSNYTVFEIYDNEKELDIRSDDISVFEYERVTVYVSGDQTGNNLTIIITNANGEIIRNESVPIDYYNSRWNSSSAEWTLQILLEAGSYNVTAIYIEYAGSRTYIHEGNNSFEVYKEASTVTIKEIKNITVGNNVTIELELTPGATGNISVFVNGLEHKTTSDNLTITIPNLGADVYTVEAFYYGDENYNSSDDTSSFRVDKNDVPLGIDTANIGDVMQINVTVGNNATGQILLDIGDNHYYANITDGVAQFNITGLKAGNHNVTARYIENSKYYENTTNSSFTISKYKPEFTINGTDIDFGRAEVITIETKDIITSLVTVEVNNENHTTFIKDGKGSLTLTDLAAGDYNITLYFPASEKYESATAKNNFTVSQVTPDIHIVIENITYGEVETITVYVNAEGNVTIKVGDYYEAIEEQIIDGVVSVDVPGLNANNYTVNVTYNGNANFTANGAEANFTVEKVDPIMSVEVENIVYGNVEYIVVHVNAEGNVTITVNGTDINETISLENGHKVIILRASRWDVPKYEGNARLDVNNLAVGRYDVAVTYNGNENYNIATATAEFNVTKADSAIKVDADAYIKVGNNATITVELPENATGNVTVEIDGVKYTSDNITDGVVKFTIENLTYGNKTIAITYSGDGNHSANFTTSRLVVDKYESSVNATIKPAINVGENPVITVEVPENATGWVVVEINNETYAINITDGARSATIKGLPSGEYPITVTYLGDDKYFASNTTSSIKVSKVPSTVNMTVENITVGDKAIINISTPTDLCGNVTVSVNGENHTVFVSGGQGTLVLYDLPVGNYTVDAVFDGCRKYEPSNSTAKFEVSSLKVDEIKVIDQGNGTLAIVAPGIENGNVTVKVGNETYNVTVVGGVAYVDLVNNTPGTYNVTVIYEGDDTHDPITVESNVTVLKYPGEIKVDASEVTEGEPLVITVEVPENATGNVTVVIDGKEYPGEVKDGVAVVTVDNLAAGNKTYVVKYSGDDNFTDASFIGNLTVKEGKSDSDITVVDKGNGTISVVVGDNAAGNVTVFVDGKNITAEVKDGVAIINLENVTPGTHEIEVVYSGDDTHKPVTVYDNVTAPKYPGEIKVDASEVTEGEPLVITVEVPENATGNVTVVIDGKEYPGEVKDGVAVVTVDNLAAGNKTYVVKYSGDDNFTDASFIGNLTVKEGKSDSDITVVDKGNGTIVVVVPGNATGNVTINVDGKNFTADVINGTAVISIENVTPGVHDVEVVYSGDDSHKPTSVNSTITAPKLETPISVIAKDSKVGDKSIITVTVPENATGNVTIEIDGVKYSEEIKDGKAIFEIENLTAGTKTIAVDYAGDDKYFANHTTGNITVSKCPSFVNATITDIDVGENVTITVTVPDDATGQVLIDIDGVGYYVNVTDGTGTAQIPRMPNGVYNVSLTYTGDDKYESSSSENSFNVSKISSFVIPEAVNITQGENEVIVFTVPSDATGNITVIINGVDYTIDVDDVLTISEPEYVVAVSGGIGKLTIQGLPKGNYTVTVRYNGDDKYLPSTNTTKFNVAKAKADVDIDNKGNGSIAVVIPDNVVNVTVVVDGTNTTAVVENGTVNVNLDNTTPGTHNISVVYMDDTGREYVINSTVVVPKYETPIGIDVSDSYVGDTVNVAVTVPKGVTGNITLEIDGREYSAKVKDGTALFNLVGLNEGGKTVIVKYGSDEYYVANSSSTHFKVSKVDSDISASSIDIVVGKDESITVIAPKDATGQVLVTIDGVGYYGTIINGKAKIIVPGLSAGKYDVTITYHGDDKYLLSTTTTSFTVSSGNPSTISISADDITEGDDAIIVVDVPSDATGNVTLVIDGKTYVSEVKNGKAVFIIPGLTSGKYTIKAYYSGDLKYEPSITTGSIVVHKKETPDPHPHPHHNETHHGSEDVGVKLSDYPTGNPILLVLLMLLALESDALRRRFKK